MRKFISILLACLLVSAVGAVSVFAAEEKSSDIQEQTKKLSESLAQAADSTRYSVANVILGDSDYLVIQNPSVSVSVAKKAHPELKWTFDEMELEDGRYVNEVKARDKDGNVQKVKVDAITGEIVSDTLAEVAAAPTETATETK